MNSTELQKKFPNVYQNFFSKNDLVMSGCFSFPWGVRSAGIMSEQLILKSRIPLKCYVGLKKRKDNNIIFCDFFSYSPSNGDFSQTNLPMISQHWDEVSSLLRKVFGGDFGGYDISILSEIEKGHSFGFSGTFAAILSTAFFVISNKLSYSTFEEYGDFLGSSLFDDIFRLAWKMEFILKNGNSIGQTIMTTLQNNSDPSFYCSEYFDPKSISIEEIGNIKYWNFPLSEKLGSSIVSSEIPLDYYILFSGIPSNTKQVEQYKEIDKRDIDKLRVFMMENIFTEDMKTGNIKSRKILETIAPHSQMSDSLGILNMMTISFFEKLLRSGYDSVVAEEFMEHINTLRHFVSIMEKQSEFAEHFTDFFKKNRKSSSEIVGILPGYSGKHGGGYIVVMKPDISIDTFIKTMQDMKSLYPSIGVEYSSHEDGESHDGIILEQYLSESIFSPYIKKGTMIYKNNQGDSYMDEYRTILERETTSLLIDAVERKIYFNGEKLTSKDIPSQSTTVDVLEMLVEHSGEDVNNSRFPSSSYVKNKNEMLGKIVIPLVRFIQEKTGIELPLVCKGSIGEFYLKLNPTELRIGIVGKIH